MREGTWMSLDVSPDGKTIAFDLLGDIYTLPASGGKATAIASGMAWEFQPRFSPDGSRLAFTSDRGGGDNIWTMAVDGSDMEQVSDESFRLLNNPTLASVRRLHRGAQALHHRSLGRHGRDLALFHARR